MSLTANSKLGPYEIFAPLGAGGMGEVYRAKDTRLDRDVAIKVLPAHLTKSTEFKLRFEREAKSISQLTHPNVCTLYDIGHHDGVDYLVMELLEGESLGQRLLKGALPLEQVLKYGVEIASALDAAHRKGVIHRDLKPGNVMLTKGGAKLLDFGLAKSGSAIESGSNAITVTQPLTSKGTILGTFQYMAPEQLEGSEADARTDIFAFGAVLYEMATGKRAFEGASRASLIVSIMSSQPRPISEIQPLTPAALDRLIRKCLAKDADSRWQSASDVADELRWITEGCSQGSATAHRSSRNKSRSLARSAMMGILMSAAAFALAWTLKPPPANPVTYLSVTTPSTDVADGGVEVLFLTISPDGRAIAYAARRDGVIQLFVRSLNQRDPILLAGTEGAHNPFFSPDGKWIGFFTATALKKIPVTGGVTVTLCETGDNRSAVWLDDDTIVLSPSFATPLSRLPAGGGVPTPVTTLDTDKHERTHRWPDALAGGEWIVFTVGTTASPGGYDDSNIEAVSLRTGQRRVLVKGGSMAHYSASGHLVFSRQGILFAVPIDAATATIHGQPVPVLNGVAGETTSGAVHFALAKNGSLIYVSEGAAGVNRELVWVDRGGQVEVIPAPPQQYQFPQISPNGKQILTSIGPGLGKGDVWRFDLERNLLTRLTFLDNVAQVMWSPDGQQMVYNTDAIPGQLLIHAMDGRTPPQPIRDIGLESIISAFAPDGSGLLVSEYGYPESNISFVASDGNSDPRILIEEPGPQYCASISPDGKWIAYASDVRGGEPEVFVRRFDGGPAKWQVSSDGGRAPLWSRDGKEIFHLRGASMMSASVTVDGENLSLDAPKKLFDIPAARRFDRSVRPYDVNAEGTRFLFARSSRSDTENRQMHLVLNWFEELNAKVPQGK